MALHITKMLSKYTLKFSLLVRKSQRIDNLVESFGWTHSRLGQSIDRLVVTSNINSYSLAVNKVLDNCLFSVPEVSRQLLPAGILGGQGLGPVQAQVVVSSTALQPDSHRLHKTISQQAGFSAAGLSSKLLEGNG